MLFVFATLVTIALIWFVPAIVGAFRSFSFARSEGARGLLLPNADFDAQAFRKIYASAEAHIRSKGAKFSDLVWYLLLPGSHMHQEVMEEGPAYNAVAAVTKELLAIPSRQTSEIITRIVEKQLRDSTVETCKHEHLRDMFMPVFARFFFELLFKHEASDEEVETIVENARDFIECTKFHKLANMKVREKVVALIEKQIDAGNFQNQFAYNFTTQEKCFYLRGLFLTSGVTQLSEAMAHILLCLAKNQDVQTRLFETRDRVLLSHVIDETMRLYPLFGVSFRIVSADITLDDKKTVPKGSVVFFQYKEYQQAGFERAHLFDPERWTNTKKSACHFMPFGEAKNHPCPAGGMSKMLLGRCVEMLLQKYTFHSTATHTRSLPNRGPCLIVSRGYQKSLTRPLIWLFLSDRVHIFALSLKQLFVGAAIKSRAHKLQIATRYFAA